jgi:hypothetical protein
MENETPAPSNPESTPSGEGTPASATPAPGGDTPAAEAQPTSSAQPEGTAPVAPPSAGEGGEPINIELDASQSQTGTMNITGKYAPTINQNYYTKEQSEPLREQIEQLTFEKIQKVFVEPAGYQALAHTQSSRVVLVHGPENSGRYTCAIRLGLHLVGGPGRGPFQYFRPVENRGLSLSGLVDLLKPERQGVYIIEDLFQTTGLIQDTFSYLDKADNALRDQGAWLLLTTTTQEANSIHGSRVATLENQVIDLGQVLEKHIDWYRSGRTHLLLPPAVAEKLSEQRDALSAILGTPVKVDFFCEQVARDGQLAALAEKEPDRLGPELLKQAREVMAGDQQVAEHWFRSLPRNAQLFALLIGLFKGLRRSTLEEFYTLVVGELRDRQLDYQDPREHGFEDFYRVLHVRTDKMEFADPALARQVEWQLRNWSHLLWSVMETVREAVKAFRNPEFWEFRQRLGHAIGRFGIGREFDRLRELLTHFASYRHGGIASVSAHALQQLCRSTSEHDADVLDLLGHWIRSRDPNQMWTAAVAAGRIYKEMAEVPTCIEGDAGVPPHPVGIEGDAGVPPHPPAEGTSRNPAGVAEQLAQLAGNFDQFHPLVRQRLAEKTLADLLGKEGNGEPVAWEELPAPRKRALEEAASQQVLDEIERLEGYNVEAILRTVQFFFDAQPAETVSLLRTWICPPRPSEEEDQEEGEGEEGEKAKATITRADVRQQRSRGELGHLAGLALFESTRAGGEDFEALSEDHHEVLLGLLPELMEAQLDTVVAPVLRVLVGWLGNPNWRARVVGGLLRAVNRATPGQRRQLCRGLLHTWLNDRDPEVRQLDRAHRELARRQAESALLRARVLEGAVCDMPGGGHGILLVDASSQGLRSNTAAETAYQFYELLRAQSDLYLGWLGRGQVWRPQPLIPLTPDALRVGHPHSRLMGPVLERLSQQQTRDRGKILPSLPGFEPVGAIDPEQIHFILVPVWGELVDGEDVFAETPQGAPANGLQRWQDRLIVAPFGGALAEVAELPDVKNEDLARLPGELRRFVNLVRVKTERWNQQATWRNQQNLEWLFAEYIEPALTPLLARRLLRRSAERWWEILRPCLPADLTPDRNAVQRHLRAEAGRLDEQTESPGRVDRARVMACLLQWLAKQDLDATVTLLADWLQDEEPRQSLAFCFVRMILRVHVGPRLEPGEGKERPDPLTVAEHGSLLRLAPLLAEREPPLWPVSAGALPQPGPALTLLLGMVRGCASQPEWVMRFRRSSGQPSELARMMRAAPYDLQEALRHQLEAWFAPTPAREGEAGEGKGVPPPQEVVLLADWLLGQMRPPARQPDPEREYGMVIFEDRRYRKAARELLRKLEAEKPGPVQIVVYRMGQQGPLALSGERWPAPGWEENRPRLIGPLLEHLPADQVRFIVVLGASVPLDLGEFSDRSRQALLCLDPDPGRAACESPWHRVPRFRMDNPRQAATEIVRSLRERSLL